MRIAALAAVTLTVTARSCAERLGASDAAAFMAINSTAHAPVLDSVMRLASNPRAAVPIFIALGAYWFWSGRQWRTCVALLAVAVFVVGVADGGGNLLKKLVNRPRPCLTIPQTRSVVDCAPTPSFPSNHAANAFALAAFIAVSTRPLSVIAFALAALVAYSRIYLGVHYPLDVVAGALFGGVLGATVAVAVRRILHSGVTDRSSSAEPRS